MSYLRSRASRLVVTILLVALIVTLSLPSSRAPAVEWSQQIRQRVQAKLKWSKAELDEVPKHLQDVYNSTLGFEKIYVVNLKSRTDYHDALVVAGASTGIKLDWTDAVRSETVEERVLPPDGPGYVLEGGVLGCWRSHMNTLREIVTENIGSALIIEGDADFDVRIKSELFNFAKASNMLLQPLADSSDDDPRYADPTFKDPAKSKMEGKDIDFDKPPVTKPPTSGSPYGDGWDILWLGHCGTHFPTKESVPNTPRGRVIQKRDPTVPEMSKLRYPFYQEDTMENYKDHTRFYHHARDNICTIAYAVSYRGARRLLYDLGLRSLNGGEDLMQKDFCDGRNGRHRHTCLTVVPELFQSNRRAGLLSGSSDVNVNKKPADRRVRKKASTMNIRLSAIMNLDKLTDGKDDFVDSYPDSK